MANRGVSLAFVPSFHQLPVIQWCGALRWIYGVIVYLWTPDSMTVLLLLSTKQWVNCACPRLEAIRPPNPPVLRLSLFCGRFNYWLRSPIKWTIGRRASAEGGVLAVWSALHCVVHVTLLYWFRNSPWDPMTVIYYQSMRPLPVPPYYWLLSGSIYIGVGVVCGRWWFLPNSPKLRKGSDSTPCPNHSREPFNPKQRWARFSGRDQGRRSTGRDN